MTDPVSLQSRGEGRFALKGPLNYDTVMTLVDSCPADNKALSMDLSGLTEVDTAGLALLVDWMAQCHSKGGSVEFVSAGPQLLALAGVCGLAGHFA